MQLASGSNVGSWFAHYKAVSSLALTSCNSVIVTGGEDAVAHAWTVPMYVFRIAKHAWSLHAHT